MQIIWFTYIVLFFNSFFLPQKGDTPTIRLDNPSFEGTPQDGTTPAGWLSCGENSTPDILPGFWGVYTAASDGNTYVGLTAREDGTWEAMAQKLRKPMQANECYSFSMDLARSSQYVGFNIPIKLRIWGGTDLCQKQQLLAESPLIKHTKWNTYNFELSPKVNYNYIIFEAQYASGIYFTYKGNILLDNCSVLKRCPRASL